MVVVVGVRAVGQGLLVVDLLSLREPCACGLPPSVVEVKELVVQVLVGVADSLYLVEVGRDVGYLVQVAWAHLTDVEVNQVVVVSVDLGELIAGEILGIEPVGDVHMLMRECNRGVAVVVSGSLNVLKLQVGLRLILIDLEVEVRLGLDLSEDILANARLLFTLNLLFKSECLELLLYELINSLLNLFQMLVIALVDGCNLGKDALLLLGASQL